LTTLASCFHRFQRRPGEELEPRVIELERMIITSLPTNTKPH
jgi:hypothetical protein